MKLTLTALSLGLIACSTQAAVLTVNLNTEFSGGTAPVGAAPWAKATFDDGGSSGSVLLTFSSLALTGSEFISQVSFNLDPALNPASLAFSAPTMTGTLGAPSVSVGSHNADGSGSYDFRIDMDISPPPDRFNGLDTVSYTITGIPTLTASSFDFLSTGGGNGAYTAAAHVQGIGPNADLGGWIGNAVPEPTSLALLALAPVLLRRRK